MGLLFVAQRIDRTHSCCLIRRHHSKNNPDKQGKQKGDKHHIPGGRNIHGRVVSNCPTDTQTYADTNQTPKSA
ncbi:hypothetical protein D3C81_2287650 [compost metagenome]